MQFDLSRLDILTPSETGRDMVIVHPATGVAFKRADGTPIKITMRGRNSSIARATLREIGNERAAMEAEARQPTAEQNDEWNTRYLCALTVQWNFDVLDGADFPCQAENAQKFWRDQRFAWLRSRALSFVSEDGNFLGS